VKALIKKKKEKENVMIYLELINLKNVSSLQFEELKKRQQRQKESSSWRTIRSTKELCNTCKHSWKGHKNKRRI
jgi:hypothetical protein